MKSIYIAVVFLCLGASFASGVMVDSALSGEQTVPQAKPAARTQPEPEPAPARPELGQAAMFISALARPQDRVRKRPMSLAEAEARIEEALATCDYLQRMEIISEIVKGVNTNEIPKLLSLAKNIPRGEDRDSFVQNLIIRWAERDVGGALTYAQLIADGGQRTNALLSVVDVWSQHDFDAAKEWIHDLPAGGLRSQALRQTMASLAYTNPERAVELGEQVDPLVAPYQLSAAYGQWATVDPRAAAERASGAKSGLIRSQAIRSVAAAWAHTDPDAAFEWIDRLPSKQERESAKVVAIASVGRSDPKAAVERVMAEQPDGDSWAMMQAVIYQADAEDLPRVFDWARRLPDEGLRAAAIATLETLLEYEDPEPAAVEVDDDIPLEELSELHTSGHGNAGSAVAIDKVCFCECPCGSTSQ
jgi:hypothetical protein